MTNRQVSVIEFTGFKSEESVIQFFDKILAGHEWGKEQYIQISNLSEKGIKDIDKHVFKKEETE